MTASNLPVAARRNPPRRPDIPRLVASVRVPNVAVSYSLALIRVDRILTARCVAGVALIVLGYCTKAKKEESMLNAQFGEAFREHCRHTGFLLPKF